ncbi:MAG TPA: four helix bundle protein, partial [Gemmatimonadaceae bacterium]|nr:four helix bundle protein [Gemmatimonadaceae bacterium]
MPYEDPDDGGPGYCQLRVWRRAMDLAELAHAVATRLPPMASSLRSQIQRAAVSVPSNIAEGSGRGSRGDFLRHVSIAFGSLRELETQLMLAARFGYVQSHLVAPALDLANEVGRMLSGLSRSIERGA